MKKIIILLITLWSSGVVAQDIVKSCECPDKMQNQPCTIPEELDPKTDTGERECVGVGVVKMKRCQIVDDTCKLVEISRSPICKFETISQCGSDDSVNYDVERCEPTYNDDGSLSYCKPIGRIPLDAPVNCTITLPDKYRGYILLNNGCSSVGGTCNGSCLGIETTWSKNENKCIPLYSSLTSWSCKDKVSSNPSPISNDILKENERPRIIDKLFKQKP